MINQVENAYEEDDGTHRRRRPRGEGHLRRRPDRLGRRRPVGAPAASGATTGRPAFQSGALRDACCAPGWMLGVIEGNAAGVTGWDIADVFPGGGGNWGGSYLTVPAQSEHPEEAKELAAWLTAPEQQIKAFKTKGTFPSQVEALRARTSCSAPRTRSSTTPRPARSSPTAPRAIVATRSRARTTSPIHTTRRRRPDRVDVNGG